MKNKPDFLSTLYGKLKFYCPWCDLELEGRDIGQTHLCPREAWERYECEYQISQEDKPPISTLDRLEESLNRRMQMLQNLPGEIETLKVLRVRLIEEQKLLDTTSQINNGGDNDL
ncbi:hypothetical protein ACBH03_001808 [Vibrio vulnificus]